MGVYVYYRIWIKNFAQVGSSIYHLFKKNTPFIWGKEQVEAMDLLKLALTSPPALISLDYTHIGLPEGVVFLAVYLCTLDYSFQGNSLGAHVGSWCSVASTLGGGVKRIISSKFVHISNLLPFLQKSREGKEIGLWNYIFYDLTRFSSGLDRHAHYPSCYTTCRHPNQQLKVSP